MTEREVVKLIQRVNALVDAGLFYTKDVFDKERYLEIKSSLAELVPLISNLDNKEITDLLRPTDSYPTPLVDVRAFVQKNNKVLLVKSAFNDEWALPGGYAEIGFSLQDNLLKELKEEAGVSGKIERLLAIFDTNLHQLQSQHYYKCVFACEALSERFIENSETVEARYFSIDALPKLSAARNTAEQIKACFKVYKDDLPVIID